MAASRTILALLVLAAAVSSSSCGYSLAGRGSFLPAYIKTIGVPLFLNNTPYFNIEQRLTDQVRAEFISRGKYQVLPQDTDVDALLLVTIVGVNIAPATFNTNQQASRYVIMLTASVQFKDVKENRLIWENPALTFSQEYDLPVSLSSGEVDPSAFLNQSSNAVQRVAQDFARSVVSAILEAF
jgi:hypothetical protein